MERRPKSQFVTVLQTCLLTGTLDALAAILISYKIPPEVIFSFIASGWFGKQAMSGGTSMVLWGLILHYLIAAIFSVTMFLLYPNMIRVIRNKYLAGIIYGLAIWVIMNFVVLPFSNTPKSHGHLGPVALIKGITALVIGVGILVALMADNFYKKAA
jgi:hypothetical protein